MAPNLPAIVMRLTVDRLAIDGLTSLPTTGISLSQPQQTPIARTSEKTSLIEVEALAADYFGIDGEASTLHSEKDETFLVRTAAGTGYILKIASTDERRDVLQFQIDALTHLAGKAIAVPVPAPISSNNGETLLFLDIRGQMRLVRMLTFLEGTLLHKAQPSSLQLASLGTALAQVGQGLADFRSEIPQQDLIWDLCHARSLRGLIPFVEPGRRDMVVRVLDAFDRLADGDMKHLPQQVIHNDFNPHNILVLADDPTTVSGVIDFGDLVQAPLVNDLAVALSYHVASGSGLEPVLTILAAFHAIRPLSALELTCLPVLLRTRLAMSIIVAEWRSSQFPENSRYILRNHAAAEAGLKKLAGTADSDLAALFRRTLGDVQ